MADYAPLISVIIPVYNVGEFLCPCLDRLQAQTYRNLEILLIDDGSADDSGARCDEYAAKDPRFQVVHKENGGVSSARNLGLDMARGEYIAFVDSDDLIEPDYFETLLRDAVEQNADVVFCNMVDIDEQGNRLGENGSIRKKARIDSLEEVLHRIVQNERRHYYMVCASLMKAERIKNTRFESFAFGEDTYFMFKVLFSRPVVYLDDYVGYFYIRHASSATMRTAKADLKRQAFYLQTHCYIYENIPPLPEEDQKFFLEQYVARVYAIAHISSSLTDAQERRYYREMLKEHLQRIMPLKGRFCKKWGRRLSVYVKYPESYAFYARINAAVRKLLGC